MSFSTIPYGQRFLKKKKKKFVLAQLLKFKYMFDEEKRMKEISDKKREKPS